MTRFRDISAPNKLGPWQTRPLTKSAPNKLGPHIFGDQIRPLQTRPPTEIWFRRLANFIIHANHWFKPVVPIKNVCRHEIMHVVMDIGTLWCWRCPFLWNKGSVECSGMFTKTCMSVLHDTRDSLDVENLTRENQSFRPPFSKLSLHMPKSNGWYGSWWSQSSHDRSRLSRSARKPDVARSDIGVASDKRCNIYSPTLDTSYIAFCAKKNVHYIDCIGAELVRGRVC